MIQLFPAGLAYISIFFTIWMSAIITVFFNLRLGWIISGLVVPGYIVTTYFIEPEITLSILGEAIITFMIVVFISEYCGRFKYWYSFVGKETFFVTLLIGIFVQLLCDHFIFPFLAVKIKALSPEVSALVTGMRSFGIVIIALTANVLHRGGFFRAFFQLICVMLILYALIRLILIPYTNFNFNSLAHHYAEMGAYIAATPKRSIMLIVTASLAIYYNYNYAWKYNGILIPALLALEWFYPWSIIISIMEAIFIFSIARIIYVFRIIPQRQFDGANKYAVFFSITLIYKMIAYHILARYFPHINVLSFYGFGYLLTTLIAVKMFDYNPVLRVTRSLLQVLILAIVVANLLGYALTAIGAPVFKDASAMNLLSTIHQLQPTLYPNENNAQKTLNPAFPEFFDHLLALSSNPSAQKIDELHHKARQMGFEFRLLNKKYILLTNHDAPFQLNYVVNLQTVKQKAVLVNIKDTPSILAVYATYYFLTHDAKVLMISGKSSTEKPTVTDMLLFHTMEKQIDTRIKNYEKITIMYHAQYPKTCDILRENSAMPIVQNGELTINLCQILQTLSPALYQNTHTEILLQGGSVFSYVNHYFNQTDNIAPVGSESYHPLSFSQLRFFDINVFTPLINMLQQHTWNDLNSNLYEKYLVANAGLLHYRVIVVRNFILLVAEHPTTQFHGLYLLNTAPRSPYLFEVPYPGSTGCLVTLATKLLARTQGRGLLISASHAYSNIDRSSDVLFFHNKKTLFNLFHQVISREFLSPLIPVQIRMMMPTAFETKTSDDIYLSVANNILGHDQLQPWEQQLHDIIRHWGLSVYLVNGDHFSGGYEVTEDAQTRYTPLSLHKQFLIMWLTPSLLNKFTLFTHSERNLKKMNALDITTVHQSLIDFLSHKKIVTSTLTPVLQTAVSDYSLTHNLSVLHHLLQQHPTLHLTYLYGDLCSPAYFVFTENNHVIFIATLDIFARTR